MANQQQIVQDVQLLGSRAGFHPITTALSITLSNSVALFPSNYISILFGKCCVFLSFQA
jgi:hypothetical protein